MRRKINAIPLLCLLMIAFCVDNAPAARQADGFKKKYSYQNKNMTLLGTGVKSMWFIKILTAGLYADQAADAKELLQGSHAKRLEVHYSYNIPAKDLARETRRRMILNTTPQEYVAIKSRVDQMDHYFVNLKPQDVYALTYIPQEGTIFSYNDKEVGRIPGEDFSTALFAVWIGDNPISPVLKNNLLGKN